MFPELFSQIKVREVAGYPRNLRRSLAATHPPATNSSDAAVIAVLPLGMYNSAFYEHAFLVGQMGAGLIEGHDLRVVDGLIVMRTTQGYKAIDVQIYEANSLQCGRDIRMGADDEYYSMISNIWGEPPSIRCQPILLTIKTVRLSGE